MEDIVRIEQELSEIYERKFVPFFGQGVFMYSMLVLLFVLCVNHMRLVIGELKRYLITYSNL